MRKLLREALHVERICLECASAGLSMENAEGAHGEMPSQDSLVVPVEIWIVRPCIVLHLEVVRQ